MRVLIAIILGLIISIALFFAMHLLISNDSAAIKENKDMPHLVYLAQKEDLKLEKKKRIKPKEPLKIKPPKIIEILKTNITPKINQNVKVQPLKTVIPRNLNISAISSLSGAQITVPLQTVFNAYNLQTLKKVNPKYPRRAKLQRKEGYVQLSFQISLSGQVLNVVIIDSNPKGVFDNTSIKAIKGWRFKPSNEVKSATIKFNFRLAK